MAVLKPHVPLNVSDIGKCCDAVQDKVRVEDPDGNFVVKGEADVMSSQGVEKPATPMPCCGPECCAPAESAAN